MATTLAPQVPLDKYPSYGVAYNAILEHIFTYPGTYKPSPLFAERNTVRHSMPPNMMESMVPATHDSRLQARPAPVAPAGAPRSATEFTSALMDQIGSMSSQPGSLPLAFINSFLRHCFPEELEMVDFPQALTGLDHLADLEARRRRDIEAALKRLRVSRQTLELDAENIARQHPSIAAWVRDVEPSERKVDALYTQLYVGLRRWILINEFSLKPFHKLNCLAMLNTLFPPMQPNTPSLSPTPALTPSVLHKQREVYIAYLKATESRGTSVLANLMNQNKRPGESTGWPAVRDTLDKYLRVTNMLIDEADAIDDWGAIKHYETKTPAPSIVPPIPAKNRRRSSSVGRLKRKTTDSGVSLDAATGSYVSSNASISTGSGARDSTRTILPPSPPISASHVPPLNVTQPLTPITTNTTTPPPRQSTSSTLEKIVHGLRKFKSRRKSPPSPTESPTSSKFGTPAYGGAAGDQHRYQQLSNNKENRTSSMSPPASPLQEYFPRTTPNTNLNLTPPTKAKDADKPKTPEKEATPRKSIGHLRSHSDIKNYSRPSTAYAANPPETQTRSGYATPARKWTDRDRDRGRDRRTVADEMDMDTDTTPRRASFHNSRKPDLTPEAELKSSAHSTRGRSHSQSRSSQMPQVRADGAEAFDRDEMMRQRAVWEAKNLGVGKGLGGLRWRRG